MYYNAFIQYMSLDELHRYNTKQKMMEKKHIVYESIYIKLKNKHILACWEQGYWLTLGGRDSAGYHMFPGYW